jgi:hypothetical protein
MTGFFRTSHGPDRPIDAPDGDTAPSILGVQRLNANEINALNFLDQTYQRRPLLPYLCVMAGRSEMSSEDLMQDSDALMVEMHAANVKQVYDTTPLRNEIEQTKLLAAVGLTACRMHATLAMKRRAQAGIAANAKAIKASTMKARAANENSAVAQEEQEMDDDTGRTPERMAEIHADIRRRLDAARAARESKQLAGRSVGATDRALPGGVEAEGGAPASPG